jgi:hypothetical protein
MLNRLPYLLLVTSNIIAIDKRELNKPLLHLRRMQVQKRLLEIELKRHVKINNILRKKLTTHAVRETKQV